MEIYVLKVLDLEVLFEKGDRVYLSTYYKDEQTMKRDEDAYKVLLKRGKWYYEEQGRPYCLNYSIQESLEGRRVYAITCGYHDFIGSLTMRDLVHHKYISITEEPLWKRRLFSEFVNDGKFDDVPLENLM